MDDGGGDVVLLERCGHLGGVLDVDAEDDGLVAVKRKIKVGSARYSAFWN